MKIYTKTGDKGQTSLVGGQRVAKHDARIETIGMVDELNAALGLAVSQGGQDELLQIQHHLFDIGAELAAMSDRETVAMKIPTVTVEKVSWLEQLIDRYSADLQPLKHFILPGGTLLASQLHVARTICRRAERQAVELNDQMPVNPELLSYLNRLSDLLFTLARTANTQAGQGDVQWQPDR